jgi:hypothetical protein
MAALAAVLEESIMEELRNDQMNRKVGNWLTLTMKEEVEDRNSLVL